MALADEPGGGLSSGDIRTPCSRQRAKTGKECSMRGVETLKSILIAAGVVVGLASVEPAEAATFKWANSGDVNSMDPYARNETFLLTFTANIYDPLVRHDRALKL